CRLRWLASPRPPAAWAWPSPLMEALNRAARRLCPRSLTRLLKEREPQILDELRRFPPSLSQAVAVDLQSGSLTPDTLSALDAEGAPEIELFKAQRISEGLVRLGGVLRIPAAPSDPLPPPGRQGCPPGGA